MYRENIHLCRIFLETPIDPGFARTGAVLSSVTGCLVFQSGLLLRLVSDIEDKDNEDNDNKDRTKTKTTSIRLATQVGLRLP